MQLQEEIQRIMNSIAAKKEEVHRLINDNATKGEELSKIFVILKHFTLMIGQTN